VQNQSDAAEPQVELVRLRSENQRLKKELEETRRDSTRYLQNVAHQLTAPLNAIKWNIEAIKDEKIPIPRKKNLLSSIYSQGTILVHLIKNFSLMSNLEADHELGQFRDMPERVSPLRLAINLAGDFEPQAAETGKRIEVGIPSLDRVFGDKVLLVVKNLVAQALSNLLENANQVFRHWNHDYCHRRDRHPRSDHLLWNISGEHRFTYPAERSENTCG
jgi:signal transduction histidine kinase